MTGICGLPLYKPNAKTASATDAATPCPCSSTRLFTDCCGPIVTGAVAAATAEALMRSRYSAFVRQDAEHLLRSWWPASRPAEIAFAARQRWLGLEIKSSTGGAADDGDGEVEFVARYKINGKAERLHERSQFKKQNGCWFYVTGEQFS